MTESRTRLVELATLAEIGRAILDAELDQDELCELIYDLAGQIVPTDNFQLGLFDGDRFQIKVWVKDGLRQPPAAFVVPEGQGIIGWLRSSREPLLVHDFHTEIDRLPARPSYQSDDPPRSAIFLPLPVADTVIGTLSIQNSKPDAFDESDLRLLTVLANQSASALNNARLYERGQRRLNDLMAVAEVGSKINSILDLNDLLTQVVQLIGSRFGYYHVQTFLVERGSNRAYFKASSGHGLNEKWQREARSMLIRKEGIIGWVAQHGEPLLANHVSTEPRYIPDDPHLLPDTGAELAVPLMVEGEVLADLVIGALLADDVKSAHRFSPRRVRILTGIASQAAVAIENARLQSLQAAQVRLVRELELARDIQRSLVRQQAPQVPGYCIVYRWQPAREVGGDFVDFMAGLPEGLGLLVADVSDKGIPAALYMMFARTLMRAVALSGREPAAMLARTNDMIVADSTADMFVTVCYSVLDAPSHTLTYASAGHNLAYYVPAGDGVPQAMTTGGIALGITTPVEIEQKVLRLAPGDLVLFYTDGVTDTLNAEGEDFGEERLAGLLAVHRADPAATIAELIDTALDEFANNSGQYDHVTLVLLKRDAI